jgi:hypothetical protein
VTPIERAGRRPHARPRQDQPGATSSRRQLALGPQTVRDLIAFTVLDVDEVGTLCDLAVTGIASPGPRRARADWPIGRFGGLDGLLGHRNPSSVFRRRNSSATILAVWVSNGLVIVAGTVM